MTENEIIKIVNEFISFELKNDKKKSNPYINEIINFIKNNKNNEINLVKQILLVCNDYISTTLLPNKYSASSLILQLVILYKQSFNKESQNEILNYIKSKFHDISCVPYFVKVMYYLYEQYPNLKEEITKQVLIIYTGENLNIPAYTQETRFFAIKILHKIINEQNFSEEKQQEKLINVIIDCIDDERDPRNIVEMFKLLDDLYKKLPKNVLIKFSKEIFEIINGFYPINFTPPKDIKNPITAKELSTLLDEIISLDYFGEYYFDEINEYEIKDAGDILQTLQKISEKYSRESLQKFYPKIMGYILNIIQNNYDENINILCLITLTTFLKHYAPYDNQIEKDFLNMSDKIFSESEIKNSFDAKDIISSIIEYDLENKFIYKTAQVIIKLISLFLFTKKYTHFLKNANSLLFFILRKQNTNSQIINLFIKNKEMFLTLIKDKKIYENNIQIFILVTDIITSLCVKITTIQIFSNEEIYNLIYSHCYELKDGNTKNYEHLSFCIVSLSLTININLFELTKNKFLEHNLEGKLKEISILKYLLQLNENKNEIINFLILNINNVYIRNLILVNLKDNYEKFRDILNNNSNQFEKIITDNFENPDYFELIIEILNKNSNLNYINILNHFLSNSLNENTLKFISISLSNLENNNSYCDSIYNNLKILYFSNKNSSSTIQDYLSECVFKLLNYCTDELKNKIEKSLISEIKNLYNNSNSESDFKLIECFYSSIINYFLLKINIENSIFKSIIQELIELINNSKFKEIFESSKLFNIPELSEEKRDYILLQMKKYHKDRAFLNLIINLYSTFNEDETKENIDLIFLTNYECLINNINSEKIILNFKKILANNTDSEVLKRTNEFKNYFKIIQKIVEIISKKDIKQNLKIEGLKVIGILKDYITEDDLNDIDKNTDIILLLKPFLCDKKRKVRRICAIVINIWTYIK